MLLGNGLNPVFGHGATAAIFGPPNPVPELPTVLMLPPVPSPAMPLMPASADNRAPVWAPSRRLLPLLVSEAVTGEQTYADSDGGLFVLRPEQIEQRVPHSKSIMPDNLADQLTRREFRDLLAFLQGRN